MHDEIPRRSSSLTEWHTLVAGLPGALVTGFIYSYSTYSNALQHALNLSEANKEFIGTAGSMCNLITFTNGLILDRTSVRTCCILGGCIMAASYTVMGLVGFGVLPVGGAAVPVLFGLGFASNYGGSFIVACVFSVLAKNFGPSRRSSVVSVAKAWGGMSAGVGTSVYVGMLPSADAAQERLGFLFFVAACTGLVPLAISTILRVLPPRDRSAAPLAVPPEWRLPLCYSLTLLLIATTLTSTASRQLGFSIALLALLASPLLIIIPRTAREQPSSARLLTNTNAEAMPRAPAAAADSDAVAAAGEEGEQEDESSGRSPLESGPLGMVRTVEFYLLFSATFALQSGGLFLTTNLGSMVASREGGFVPAATAVTVFSCFQATARLFTGVLTDALVRRGVPRTIGFAILTLLMAAAHAILCLRGPIALLSGTALAGVAFGAVYPLLVLAIAELYGRARVASNYMIFDGMPGAIGVFIIANVLASAVYKAHTDPNDPDNKCYGDACFRLAHVTIVVIELVGSFLGVVLTCRTWSVYQHLAATTPLTPEQPIPPYRLSP